MSCYIKVYKLVLSTQFFILVLFWFVLVCLAWLWIGLLLFSHWFCCSTTVIVVVNQHCCKFSRPNIRDRLGHEHWSLTAYTIKCNRFKSNWGTNNMLSYAIIHISECSTWKCIRIACQYSQACQCSHWSACTWARFDPHWSQTSIQLAWI